MARLSALPAPTEKKEYEPTILVGRRARVLARVISGWEESRFRLSGTRAAASPETAPVTTGAAGCPVRSDTVTQSK